MKNTYILTIDYDQEKAKNSPSLADTLNISEERFQSLMAAAIYDYDHAAENGKEQFDGCASFIRLLEEDKFNGNEIMLYAVTGYLSVLRLMPTNAKTARMLEETGVEDITV